MSDRAGDHPELPEILCDLRTLGHLLKQAEAKNDELWHITEQIEAAELDDVPVSKHRELQKEKELVVLSARATAGIASQRLPFFLPRRGES